MSEECRCDDNLAAAIAELVGKHPASYYPMKLEDSHVSCHGVKLDFFNDIFCNVFNSYNCSLFECVRLMVRYEKLLSAWQAIIDEVDDRVIRGTLMMDYVHPTFTVLCDLPNVFKDRLARGCVKLASVSKGDCSCLNARRRN